MLRPRVVFVIEKTIYGYALYRSVIQQSMIFRAVAPVHPGRCCTHPAPSLPRQTPTRGTDPFSLPA